MDAFSVALGTAQKMTMATFGAQECPVVLRLEIPTEMYNALADAFPDRNPCASNHKIPCRKRQLS